MLLSSLTKSFNGLANAMGGSIVLNPLSPHYSVLSQHWTSFFNNELFVGEAAILLENSKGFLDRTARFNRNALAIAEHLQTNWVGKPDSPVTAVRYPPLLSTRASYDHFLRPSTAELPTPGYGCLLTVDFASEALAAVFYDRLGYLPTTHLAAPETLHFAYNMLVFGKKAEEREKMRRFGLKEEAVRISAGWKETVEDLIETLEDALKVTAEAVVNGNRAEKPVNGTGVETPVNGSS
jgi:cystathionine gamma-synthase